MAWCLAALCLSEARTCLWGIGFWPNEHFEVSATKRLMLRRVNFYPVLRQLFFVLILQLCSH